METIKSFFSLRLNTYIISKRCLDIFSAVLLLVLLSPVILVVTVVLYLMPRHNVIFKQERIGQNRKKFRIVKFCTMVNNAENVLKDNTLLYQEFVENGYKLDQNKDPRITKVGSFLRKSSIDEIPQLINVLKGDMSLVGPRPVINSELKEYGDQKDLFLSAKPGITGYWQVSGRSNVGYPERKELELFYIEKKSFTFDISIIFKTVKVVLTKNGAC
ncbi:sugar transferase [Halobacillus ihumii]|uniref:sugar transferase n=1 Tax=Halobacillus ihumii TaxID=2686092 RepID=UPI0013D759CA|nr:sugar transferase [Halobacillus ihumii]